MASKSPAPNSTPSSQPPSSTNTTTSPPPPTTIPPPLSSSNSPPLSATTPSVPPTTSPPSRPSASPPQNSPPLTPSQPAQSPPHVTPPPTTSPSPPSTPPSSSPTPPAPPQRSSPPPQPHAPNPPGSSPSRPSRPPGPSSPPPPRTTSDGSPPPPPSPPQQAPVPPLSSTPPPTPESSSSPPASLPTPTTPATSPSSTLPGNTPPAQPSRPRSPPSRISPPSPRKPVPPSVNRSSPIAPDTSNSSGNRGIDTSGVVVVVVVAALLVLGLIGLAFCILRKRKKNSGSTGGYVMPASVLSSTQSGSDFNPDSTYTKTQSSPPVVGSHSGSRDFVRSSSEPSGLGNSRTWFTYEELLKATNGFAAQNLLGGGGFGSVYKGYLSDGRVVAVKQLKVGGGQGEREFQAEVEIISRVHHRHLVSIVGYCISENRRLLVYDYVPNNTLYFHLHGKGRPVLDWAIRVKVAVGAARGIAYLHEDCDPRIIHRDIKSSNILLDNNFEARVSDFGLAKLCLDANTHVTTRVMGTFGYMAPEYASSGKLTEKSDVFSFGVVLLELITGRKSVDPSQPIGHESLVEWARPLLRHALETEEFEGLVDPRLGNNYVQSEVFRMIEAAAACVRHSATKRPRMGQIVRAFENLDASDLSNGMRPGESEKFIPAPRSAEIRLFQRMAFGGDQDFSTDIFSQSSWSSEK